ncbi:MAG: hypothetical protein EOO22_04480 [Comamonadaceae bacterium]|nr:MAG: hypothetical protein EOO22_04480 [Comamonadaceae bacterium]
MILVKTDAGNQVLRDRSVRLTPRQRSAFILFDGKRTIDEVLASGMGILKEDVDHLSSLGLISAAADSAGASPVVVGSDAPPPGGAPSNGSVALVARSPQQRYQDAYPIATQLTASLGLRGFKLNLAVEGAGRYEDLVALAPKIRAAVGVERAAPLDRALDL